MSAAESMAALREELRALILQAGAAAAGFVSAAAVRDSVEAARCDAAFGAWLDAGCHASMSWLEEHRRLRRDPDNVLPGVATIVAAAFPYSPSAAGSAVAAYACRADYHKALRRLLRPAVALIESRGGKARVCVDSAPLPERMIASMAGIGRRGDNGCLIVDGAGSYILLAELLTDLPLPADTPSELRCDGCGACVRACPGGAIRPDGTVDSRRCLSYLTIEHRGDLSANQRRLLLSPAGRGRLFGCDICQQVCPHNRELSAAEAIATRPEAAALRPENIDPATLDAIIAGTPLRRAGCERLLARAAEIAAAATDE